MCAEGSGYAGIPTSAFDCYAFCPIGHVDPYRHGAQAAVADIVQSGRAGINASLFRLKAAMFYMVHVESEPSLPLVNLGGKQNQARARESLARARSLAYAACRLIAAILPRLSAASSYDTR